ncbi:MAG: zinc ribbon domain-containing protein [Acidobacteria bacterium]|nr:zinc ribbon domain-containing protein [Acidobacteriota bacterium]
MFCNYCGKEFQAGQVFCAYCGKPLAPEVAPGHQAAAAPLPSEGRVARNLRLLAVLWLAVSALRLVQSGALLTMRHSMPFFLDRLGLDWGLERLIPRILSMVGGLMLVSAVAGLIAGWGLLERRSWARVLAMVLGALALIRFPFGTALGVYTLWVLLPSQSEREYHLMARPA